MEQQFSSSKSRTHTEREKGDEKKTTGRKVKEAKYKKSNDDGQGKLFFKCELTLLMKFNLNLALDHRTQV